MGTAAQGPNTLGHRLEEAIRDAGYSVRSYAKVRAERSYQTLAPTDKQIGVKRRQLGKWISGETPTITDRLATELAADLGKPADYFRTPRGERSVRLDRLAVLEETAVRGEDLDRATRPLREAILALAKGDTRAALRALSEGTEA